MCRWSTVLLLAVGLPLLAQGQYLGRAPLPYQHCELPKLWISENDTLRKQAVLDSISSLMAGHWQLVEAGAGACFAPPYAPDLSTEMWLDKAGQGEVYQAGRLLISFQLQRSVYWNNVRFLMSESLPIPYFGFRPLKRRLKRQHDIDNPYAYVPSNVVKVCEQAMYLYGNRTGLSFVFKRLPNAYGTQP